MREAEEHWQKIEKWKLTWSSTRPLKTRMSITPLSDRDVSVKKTGSGAAAARMPKRCSSCKDVEAVQQLQGCRSGAAAARMPMTHQSHERSFQNVPSNSSLPPHEWCPEGEKAVRMRGKWIEGTNNKAKRKHDGGGGEEAQADKR
jgi:hypothetical protein